MINRLKMEEKKLIHRKIIIHRGMFDQIEIGVATISIKKNGFFDIESIREIKISEPFNTIIKGNKE